MNFIKRLFHSTKGKPRFLVNTSSGSRYWYYLGRRHGIEEGKREALQDIAIKNGGVDKATEDRVTRFLIDEGVRFTFYPEKGGLILTRLESNNH